MPRTPSQNASNYNYRDHIRSHSHAYLLPALEAIIQERFQDKPIHLKSAFDLGCGNGSVGAWMHQKGWSVTGVDPSTEGVAQARENYPELRIEEGSAYDPLSQKYGQFPLLISLEVVEHVYDPRSYAKTAYDLLSPGGFAIISTPYHGYTKNLALALSGKMDSHFTALWDNGHIKFWSVRTLSMLLEEAGFNKIHFKRVGRIPSLAKSMIAIAEKPKSN